LKNYRKWNSTLFLLINTIKVRQSKDYHVAMLSFNKTNKALHPIYKKYGMDSLSIQMKIAILKIK
jgi:hypothetical protein